MSVKIDHSKAEAIILEAFKSSCTRNDEVTEGIGKVLNGNHKTYKYVLVNGILAKATSNKVNPIALQAGAPFSGAFDARSLCHKVVVPFERDFLNNVLGGSNEPFLNKPARFTHLSKDNAVRKGKDKAILLLIIKLFSHMKTSELAKDYLACVFFHLKEQIAEESNSFISAVNYTPTLIEIYAFCLKFIERSYEGESSVIIVGTFETLYHKSLNGKYKVTTHKVNQSGASSKEVGDIDIFENDLFYYSIEVKDKNFNKYDVEHAFNKVLQNNGKKAGFIYGYSAKFAEKEILEELKAFEDKGLFVMFQDIRSYLKNILFRLPIYTKEEFINELVKTSKSINCKKETSNWIKELILDENSKH